MNTRDAFLQKIREEPEDDIPRLVYADWLEEHGEAKRAAFIRLDIEKSRMADDFNTRRIVATAENAAKLSALSRQSHQMWPRTERFVVSRSVEPKLMNPNDDALGHVHWPPAHKQFDLDLVYRRGFAIRVSGTLEALLTCGPQICQYEMVESVQIYNKYPHPDVADYPDGPCSWICRVGDVSNERSSIDYHLYFDQTIPKDQLERERMILRQGSDTAIAFPNPDRAQEWLRRRVWLEIAPDSQYYPTAIAEE